MESTTAGAKALEARLYAPCCYNGTLDTHASELARSLRDEIEARLKKGDTSETIQSDFVGRYGANVIAARSDAPIRTMGVTVVLGLVVVAIALLYLVRSWTRRAAAPLPAAGPRDALDDRIDAALDELD